MSRSSLGTVVSHAVGAHGIGRAGTASRCFATVFWCSWNCLAGDDTSVNSLPEVTVGVACTILHKRSRSSSTLLSSSE
eukprot:7039868-Pyramimonas_sp.AAC.1